MERIVADLLSEEKIVAGGLLDASAASFLSLRSVLLHFEPKQVIHLEDDDAPGLLVFLTGHARAYMRAEGIEAMEQNFPLNFFLRKASNDLRMSSSQQILAEKGIEALRKRLINSVDKRRSADNLRTDEELVAMAMDALKTDGPCVVVDPPCSDYDLTMQCKMEKMDHISLEFMKRRVRLTVDWKDIGTSQFRTFGRADIFGMGEHLYSRVYSSIIAEDHTTVLYVDHSTVDRFLTKAIVDHLSDTINSITRIMPYDRNWVIFAERFATFGELWVSRLGKVLDPTRIYSIFKGEIQIRSKKSGIKAIQRKLMEPDDESPEIASLRATSSRNSLTSSKIPINFPIVDVLTKSELVLLPEASTTTVVVAASALVVTMSISRSLCELVAADEAVQQAIGGLAAERQFRYELKAERNAAWTSSYLNQASAHDFDPKTVSAMVHGSPAVKARKNERIVPMPVVSTTADVSLNQIDEVPFRSKRMMHLALADMTKSAVKATDDAHNKVPQKKNASVKVKFTKKHLRREGLAAKVWSKGNSREKVTNIQVTAGYLSNQGSPEGPKHIFSKEEMEDDLMENLEILRGLILDGKPKFMYQTPDFTRKLLRLNFNIKNRPRATSATSSNKALSSVMQPNPVAGVDGSYASWLLTKQSRRNLTKSRFAIKGTKCANDNSSDLGKAPATASSTKRNSEAPKTNYHSRISRIRVSSAIALDKSYTQGLGLSQMPSAKGEEDVVYSNKRASCIAFNPELNAESKPLLDRRASLENIVKKRFTPLLSSSLFKNKKTAGL